MSNDKTHFGYQSVSPEEKTEKVREVFHSVANHYDQMNDLMSLGLHRLWKKLAIKKCSALPHHQILDLAGGTGDLSFQLASQTRPPQTIILADINEAMLKKGRERAIDAGFVTQIACLQLNAESLPLATNSLDRIILGFGLRNMTYKEKALEEMFRVLKPGGKVVILEFSHIRSPLLKKLYDAYSFTVLPFLGKKICQDEASYRYLAESIRMHPDQETLKHLMEQAGFERCEYQDLHAGLVALHMGWKL